MTYVFATCTLHELEVSILTRPDDRVPQGPRQE
jgi:hypothetical protein